MKKNILPVLLWRNAIRDDRALTSSQKLVAFALQSRMNGTGWANPSKKRIAEDASLSVRTVDAAVDQLETAGYLRIERSKGHTSWHYHATIQDLDVAANATSTAQQVPRNGATAATSNVATDAPNVATDAPNVATTATEDVEDVEDLTTTRPTWARAVTYVKTIGWQLQPPDLEADLHQRFPTLTNEQVDELLHLADDTRRIEDPEPALAALEAQ